MFCPLFSLPSPEEGLTSDRSVAGTVAHFGTTGAGRTHGRSSCKHGCVVIRMMALRR
jgi:hypothetical protein